MGAGMHVPRWKASAFQEACHEQGPLKPFALVAASNWWRRRELNSLPKLSAFQLPRASPLYFISTLHSAGAACAMVQFDFFRLDCYEQKLSRRSGFGYTRHSPYRLGRCGCAAT
jgi:hypothetical protein